MKKLRYGFIVMWLLMSSAMSAEAQVSIGIGLPNVSIGINLPLFPELVPVSGYPVYYAPRVDANYFFYDGYYWVYQDDNWYASSWYNGPWTFVEPMAVPLYILRIPVRYYRQPPVYFREWRPTEPPRWGQHWGRDWEKNRRGWERWNRSSVPRRAPLPVYQRQYTGERYPQLERQHELRSQKYRYQPRDRAVREHVKYKVERRESAPVKRENRQEPAMRAPQQRDEHRSAPQQQVAPPQRQHQVPPQHREERSPKVQKHEQRPQERDMRGESNRGHGREQGRDEGRGRGEDRGRDEGRGRGKD